MLKSMTGFGRGTYESQTFNMCVEMKSVNSRYSEINIRMPRFLNPLEDRIRKEILSQVNRGKVDVYISADYEIGDNINLQVDGPLAMAYHNALTEIAKAVNLEITNMGPGQEISFLAKTPDVIKLKEGLFDVEAVWQQVQSTVNEVINELITMRQTEGANIKKDFLFRADKILELVADIEARSPQVVAEYQKKLHQRLQETLDKESIKVDPDRVLQEVAIFADRTAITEEIIRLKSHVKQFKSMLESDEPVGRKLDFLIQEFNREANTIGSKGNDYEVAQMVIDLKAEIEKIREQVQNIE